MPVYAEAHAMYALDCPGCGMSSSFYPLAEFSINTETAKQLAKKYKLKLDSHFIGLVDEMGTLLSKMQGGTVELITRRLYGLPPVVRCPSCGIFIAVKFPKLSKKQIPWEWLDDKAHGHLRAD